jgi:hypothetical protein
MTKTKANPLYVFTPQSCPATRTIEDVDGTQKVLSLQREGPTNYLNLRKGGYGSIEGGVQFAQASFGLLGVFAYAGLENDDESENGIVNTMRNYWIAGRTLGLTTKTSLFAYDNPEIKDSKVYLLLERDLIDIIGANNITNAAVGDVLYSEDGLVRYTPQGFKLGKVDSLTDHAAIITGTGNNQRAQLLGIVADNHHSERPYIGSGLGASEEPVIVVPEFGSGGRGGLYVGGGDLGDGGYSFGEFDGGKAGALKE